MSTGLRQLTRTEYPGALNEIPDPPPTVWARGTPPPQKTKLLAVVGSRALSPYGRQTCDYLVRGLSGYPISIISGLALGADACAHRAALAAGLHTIAVPGSGLDDSVLYPRSNAGLAHNIIAAGGMLISEHEPLHKAEVWDFPSRNRIMAGMADAVLLIEAGEKSGTLITARLTVEYNRELLCVPHHIGDAHGVGNHQFIRLGATLVTEPAHILEALRLKPREEEARPLPALTLAEQKLYDALIEPLPKDELIRASGLPVGEALTALISLELAGVITETYGAWQRV